MSEEISQKKDAHEVAEQRDRTLELPKIVRFDDIARCGQEIWIECSGQLYRLRKTRQGKLILTK